MTSSPAIRRRPEACPVWRGWLGAGLVAIVLPGLLAAQAAPGTEPAPADPATAAAAVASAPPTAPASPAASTETPAAAADTAAAPTPPPGPPRITFELKVPAERGGGALAGSAAALETQGEDTIVASGGVEIRYQDVVLTAQEVVLDRKTQRVEARGEVTFDQGPQRLTGASAVFDLAAKTGTLIDATGFLDPDYYIKGKEIAKVGEHAYTVVDGTFTSCKGDPVPDWSFRLAKARVDVGGYARLKHASMWVKKVPILYLPYILWPAKTERTSGFLVPGLGYSKRHGGYLGLSYYQVLGPSWDTTFLADGYTEGFFGFGNELRYRPTEGTKGTARAYAIRDPDLLEWRWKVDWEHQSNDLPAGLRGVVSYHDYSDFDFFRDFERDLDQNSLRSIYSRAFLSGNWGPHSLNALADKRETFVSDDSTVVLEQLPEIEYRLRNLKLGRSPLYLNVLSTSSFLVNQRSEDFKASYGRLDVAPDLTLPLRAFSWLSVSISGGGRATWYGDSLPEARPIGTTGAIGFFCGDTQVPGGQVYCGDPLTRFYPSASAEIVGPSFSKVFDRATGGFAKFKHIVEPRFTYGYLGTFDHPESVPLFDEIDNLRSRNAGSFSLVNRVLAKPKDEKQGGAREILSFELTQAYSFDNSQPLQRAGDGRTSAESPISGLLRFYPSRDTSLQAQAIFNTLDSGLESTSLTAGLGLGRSRVGLTWFTRYRPATGETLSDQMRLTAGVNVVPRRLRFDAMVAYDLKLGEIQQQLYTIDYNSQCWGVRLEAQEFRAIDRLDRNYRLSLTLKNVGSFLDLTGGQSNQN